MSEQTEDLQGQTPEPVQEPAKTYRLTFQQNRKFELTTLDGVLFFGPYESKPDINEATVKRMTDQEKSFFNVEVMQ